ncbi:cyclase [Aeromicrobium sp. SMF47]|uniref:Cyclase n=2 Tax=Nocardioidaceae TaxID=85015 RepID=A0A5Q2MMC6_9ACTN|nr:cyclase [Aeromicrobium yanjiei]MRK02190.1 cyclase [Aeromicrobium sp. S22]QGG41090.1 cyclase [Aeromicrobium yanjiei]
MMARTTSDIVIDATPDSIMGVIADFASYPVWATGVKTADVVVEGEPGRAKQVHFVLDASPIRDEYDLGYVWDGSRTVSWSLVEPGKMLTSMDGAYVLEPLGDAQTRVTYQLAVDVSVPLLGMLKRKAEKVIIDTALKGLKKQVEAL